LLDGQEKISQTNSIFHLADLERGEHHLQVIVKNSSGVTLIRSNPVTFYFKQSIIND